jgi:hypothetical protein
MAVKILNGIDVNGSMNIAASDVPNLDASKITSGTFSIDRIPNLSSVYQPLGDYLTSETAGTIFQPLGNYLTSVPSTFDVTSIGIGNKVTISESTDREDLLYINSHTEGWGGLQIGNTSNEFIFSLMGNGNAGGIYDDQNSDWIIYWDENAGVQLNHNSNNKLNTVSDGVNITGRLYASSGIEVPYGVGQHRPMVVLSGATNYGLFHTEATNDEFTFDFNGTQKFKFSQDGILTVNGNTVTTGKITNWDTAYGWGNHASVGYLTSLPSHNHDTLYDAIGSAAAVQNFVNEQNFATDAAISTAIATVTLASLGYTGATNANYITNNNQLTNGAGYTSNTGTITGVSTGAGLDGVASSGAVTITLDLSELADMTAAVDPTVDEIILLDNGAERRKLFSEIFGSAAYQNTSAFDSAGSAGAVNDRIDTDVLPAIPTNNSQLTNGAGYITSQRAISSTPTNGATTTAISSDWAFDNVKTAVPANAVFTDTNTTYSVGDNGLTEKNFTATLKTKLDGIAAGATNVTNNNQLTNGAGYATETWINEQNFATDGAISTAIGAVTLASLGYTGATNANYITNNNQLTNGAGYLTSIPSSYATDTEVATAASNAEVSAKAYADTKIETEVLPSIPTNNNQLINGAGYITDGNTNWDNSYGFITSSSSITGTSAGVVKTVSGTSSAELVRGNMGDNDQARILVGASASNAGYLEIATADDGTEPIYVRQYTGVFSTLTRTATILDASGNTSFPGTVSASNHGNSANWKQAYDNYITGAAFSGTTTKTLTLTQRDGGTITANFTDLSGTGGDGNDFLISAAWDAGSETITLEVANQTPVSVVLPNVLRDTTYSVGDNGLTEKNFTSTLKTKLDGIAASANNYVHPTTAGNKHIPAGGAAGQFLKYSADGTAVWAADNNTTYSVGDNGLTEKNFTSTLKTKLDGIAASANNYSLPEATSTVRGGIELFSDTDNPTAANAVSSTAGRTYGIQLNSAGQAVVNVPWVDTNTNTTYTAGTGLTLSGTQFSVTANTYAAASHNHNDIYYTETEVNTLLATKAASSHTHTPTEAGLGNLSASGNNLAGSFTATGDITAYSDARVKENIETLSNALESVKQMRGVTYNKIGEEKQSIGVIAQELEEVVPQLVHTNEEGMKSVAYGNITALLIEALKEQQEQIEELKARLDGLTK